MDDYTYVLSQLRYLISKESVASGRARYPGVPQDLLVYAVAFDLGIGGISAVQDAVAASRQQEVHEFQEIIERQVRIAALTAETLSMKISNVNDSVVYPDENAEMKVEASLDKKYAPISLGQGEVKN